MAVEPTQGEAVSRQLVQIGWDLETVTGEVVQLRCVNPDNGDVSVSGVSKNDGIGYVSYPLGYAGMTQITVADNDGNSDSGFIEVDGEGNASIPEAPTPPPDVPTDPTDPDAHPEHPIVIPPVLPPDFWTGNLPPFVQPVA
jgi:hypothetical protein